MKTLRPALLFVLLSLSFLAKAEESPSGKGWYVGVGTGIPFSASSFSSFAPKGPYAGWATSLYGGYSFNEFWGMEVDFGFGRSNLAAREGCIGNNYYLGADDVLYYSAPLGIKSWSVADFKTRVSYRTIGLGLNFNLLSLVPSCRQSRWNLALSPRMALYNTSQALLSLSEQEILRPEENENLHFGYGVSLKIGYQISKSVHLGLNSSFSALTGKGLDGIPDHGHKANLIWENTLRLTFDLFRNNSDSPSADSGYFYEQSPAAPNTVRAVYLPAKEDYSIAPAPLQAAANLAELAPRQTLPETEYIYFEFDKWNLEPAQCDKLQNILEALLSDEKLQLSLEGWSDRIGSDEVCDLISGLRAESVKEWFVGKGLSPDRIIAEGKGRDKTETVNSLARRVKVEVHPR